MVEERIKNIDEVFCSSCGSAIKMAAEICVKCGVRQRGFGAFDPNASDKSRLIALVLAWFFGIFGAHRFYAGRITSGVLQLLFGWATLFIWNLVDIIMILAGAFKDVNGKPIKDWNPR